MGINHTSKYSEFKQLIGHINISETPEEKLVPKVLREVPTNTLKSYIFF